MDFKELMKKLLPHFIVVAAIIALNFVYFAPQFQGKITEAWDMRNSIANNREINELTETTGKTYKWNNGIFSGMPWGLLNLGSTNNLLRYVEKISYIGFKYPAGFLIKAGLLCYLAFILLRVNPWVSALGAIAFMFNLDFTVLIEAGHSSKLNVIGNFPLLLAGVILCYRKDYIKGFLAASIATAFAILENHPQMVYYFIMSMFIFGLIYLVYAIKEKALKEFLISSLVVVLATGMGALTGTSQLISASSYSKDTMRGAPILKTTAVNSSSSSSVSGLNWDYAMAWSNTSMDVFSAFVPRFVGGSSSEEIASDSRVGKLLVQNGAPRKKDGNVKAPMYWGGLTLTSGPYYLGAIIIFLCVLGFFTSKSKLKWALSIPILVVMIISMGRHVEGLTQFLFDYLPMYNKFRAPSSIMNITPVFAVLLAGYSLNNIIRIKKKKELIKPLLNTLYVCGGFCVLLFILGSTTFSFTADGDARYQEQIINMFKEARKDLFNNDVFRTLVFFGLAFALIFLYLKDNIKKAYYLVAGLLVLVLVDSWTVNKRYLDEDKWINSYSGNVFKMRQADAQIKQLETKGRGYYRVFDFSVSSFNDAFPSYFHNNIGGYHGAKLQRYQDMIDFHIGKGKQSVLNMLNAKYIINREQQLIPNPQACGNAWFVSNVQFVTTPNEEIEILDSLNTANSAVILKSEFEEQLKDFAIGNGEGSIELTKYEPDHLVYKSNSAADQLAVFSEIWYGPNKGWNITIDGNPAKMVRANYILRALVVPAGEHEIVFSFKPQPKASFVSIASSGIILLVLIGSIVMSLLGKALPFMPKKEN